MDFTSLNNSEKKRTLIALLITMANADLELHPNEAVYIFTFAKQVGLTQEDVIEISKTYNKMSLEIPKADVQRVEYFLYALTVMKADGDISKDEEHTAMKIALTLGIRQAMAHDIIEMQRYELEDGFDPERLNEIILKYVN